MVIHVYSEEGAAHGFLVVITPFYNSMVITTKNSWALLRRFAGAQGPKP